MSAAAGAPVWDYAELQERGDKLYELWFLPYLDTYELVGYQPARARRGYGYGRWSEYFRTEQEARARMDFLVSQGAIEAVELRKLSGVRGHCDVLLDEWKDPRGQDDDDG